MEKKTWKDKLAREVFDWGCYALEQTPEENAKYWNDPTRPPAELCRAVGWNEAIRVVQTAFTRKGFVGVSITLAADEDGPAGKSYAWTPEGWEDNTEFSFHTEKPFKVLSTLREQLKKSHWQYASQLPGNQWFHGAPGAVQCAIDDITRIMQDVCDHEPDNLSPYFGHDQPEIYEPGYYYYTCKHCRAEVLAVTPISEEGFYIEPTYTGTWDD